MRVGALPGRADSCVSGVAICVVAVERTLEKLLTLFFIKILARRGLVGYALVIFPFPPGQARKETPDPYRGCYCPSLAV